MAFDYDKYLRPGKLPHIWCPGCGHGIVMKGLIRAIDTLGLEKNNTAIVSGIGCASRLPGYIDCCTLHTAHGRAAAFATGVKMAKPEMNVILVGGDGDGTAIGGNHFIHACRRNIDMTYIIMNNNIYGMTGGQFSPCTPTGAKASMCQAPIEGDEFVSDFRSCRAREWKFSPMIRGEKMAMSGKLQTNTYISATSP
jgi:2-oxoglutarate ferredoxin oxidoreductase subunit beta